MRHLRFILKISLIILVLKSCINPNDHNETSDQIFLPKDAQELWDNIKDVEYRSVSQMARFAKALEAYEHDSLAQIIGRYYVLKSNYYSASTPESFEEIVDYYSILKASGLTRLMLDADLLLFRYFYGDRQYENAVERMKMTFDYIFVPEFDKERAALIYGISPIARTIGVESKKNEIEEILETFKGGELDIYEALI